MHYILEKCMHVRGGMEGLKSDIKMVLKHIMTQMFVVIVCEAIYVI